MKSETVNLQEIKCSECLMMHEGNKSKCTVFIDFYPNFSNKSCWAFCGSSIDYNKRITDIDKYKKESLRNLTSSYQSKNLLKDSIEKKTRSDKNTKKKDRNNKP